MKTHSSKGVAICARIYIETASNYLLRNLIGVKRSCPSRCWLQGLLCLHHTVRLFINLLIQIVHRVIWKSYTDYNEWTGLIFFITKYKSNLQTLEWNEVETTNNFFIQMHKSTNKTLKKSRQTIILHLLSKHLHCLRRPSISYTC